MSLPWRNQRGDCVVAKSARLRFRLVAKASPAPLLLHLGLRAAAMRRLASKRACGRSFRTRSASLGSRPRQGLSLTLPLNDVQGFKCGAGGGGNVDAGAEGLRHSEAAGRGIPPPVRGTRPTVDAGGLPSPPSSSRSGDPPVRGGAVRCRYPGGTIWGIPAQSARMTAELESACR